MITYLHMKLRSENRCFVSANSCTILIFVEHDTKMEVDVMVKAINSDAFENEVLKAEGLVVVDMYADWCGPCKMMAPVLDGLSEDYEDVKFVKINVDNNPDVAERYGVQSIPNFVFIKNGEKVNQIIGARDADSFADAIDAAK